VNTEHVQAGAAPEKKQKAEKVTIAESPGWQEGDLDRRRVRQNELVKEASVTGRGGKLLDYFSQRSQKGSASWLITRFGCKDSGARRPRFAPGDLGFKYSKHCIEWRSNFPWP
jgi:hypothetical protein